MTIRAESAQGQKLNRLTIIFSVIAFGVVAATVFAVFTAISVQSRLENTRERCEAAIQLFLNGSDTLTREVFAYADTGDAEHMRAYWSEADQTQSRSYAYNELNGYSLSTEEQEALNLARMLSNDLMTLETHAMRLIAESDGLTKDDMSGEVAGYRLTQEEQALSAEEKVKQARLLLFGREYATQKNKIVRAVRDFSYHLNNRFGKTAVDNIKGIWILLISGFALFTLLNLFFFLMMHYSESIRRRTLQREIETARVNDQFLRVAVTQLGKRLIRYSIAENAFISENLEDEASASSEPRTVHKLAELFEEYGELTDDYAKRLDELCEKIRGGAETASVDIVIIVNRKRERWFRIDATTLFGDDHKAILAAITYFDCTEQLEHEMDYARYQKEYSALPMDRIALYEYNLTQDIFEQEKGGLLPHFAGLPYNSFNKRTCIYAEHSVYSDDRTAFTVFLNRDRLIGAFQNAQYNDHLDYREKADNHWFRMSLQMVPYPDSRDIKLYISVYDIDEEKRAELELITQAERDPLTGVYNRKIFAEKVSKLFQQLPNETHLLIMLDIDDFKRVNDNYGHSYGDKVLQAFTAAAKKELRSTDLVGRIGGDEFMICVIDIPLETNMIRKMKRLASAMSHSLDCMPKITVSMGASIYPKDGRTFDELYHDADTALYRVKKNKKNDFCFYSSDMEGSGNLRTEIDTQRG